MKSTFFFQSPFPLLRNCLLIGIFLYSPFSSAENIPTPSLEEEKILAENGSSLSSSLDKWEPYARKLTIDLREPTYKEGVLTTQEGGVIKNENIRIQATSIIYTKKTEKGKLIHHIAAEGDLMVQYKGRAYIGEKLEYDLTTSEGVLYQGKTFFSPWYIGGEKIILQSDGSYTIHRASLTTCESSSPTWDVYAGKIEAHPQGLIEAKNMGFRVYKIPILYLPFFRANVKKFEKLPLVRYSLSWDRAAKQRVSMRYQVYSWKDFALYLRLDYRLAMGWGGAAETAYLPEHGRTSFVTRNYVASDTIINEPLKRKRYRFQGAFHSVSPSGKTRASLTWDKYSDIRMPGDFPSPDFEVNTAKRSQCMGRHEEENLIALLSARARVNSFNSVEQKLPSFLGSLRPISLGKTGVILETYSKLSYLDYVYSEDLTKSLKDFHSGRIEMQGKLYRPIRLGKITLTPKLGAIGIYYSNTPFHQAVGQGIITYGGDLKTQLHKSYSKTQHVIEPYLLFQGLTHPTKGLDRHFIFSIEDGYYTLNQLQIGVRNLLFSKKRGKTFASTLYANAFLGDSAIPTVIPKTYLTLNWYYPSLILTFSSAWDFRNQVLDHSNLRTLWTCNEDLAISFSLRYRSSYDYRKADHENFILDVARPQSSLETTPLSDQRMTFLADLYFRITPLWTAHFQSHSGWLRKTESPYHEFRLDLFTQVSSSWKVRLSYQHTQRDDRVTAGIELLKKP